MKEKPNKPTYADAVSLLLETCQILTKKVDKLEDKVDKLESDYEYDKRN